jgi:hypothetical protein
MNQSLKLLKGLILNCSPGLFTMPLILITLIYVMPALLPQQPEVQTIHELFRLRNQHKADSAALLFADTVKVYMKYLRNVSRKKIAEVDRDFWKAHPKNKFEMTEPVKIKNKDGIKTAIIYGKEFLDGKDFKKERIEITFDRSGKISAFRGYSIQ